MSLIDIALIIELFEDLLNLLLMISICSTDEFIVGGIHHIPDRLDLPCHIINKFLRCDPCCLCLQLDLLTVLICSCLEIYVIALFSLIAGDGVCQNDLISISNVRFAGCICNCGGNIVWLLTILTHSFSLLIIKFLLHKKSPSYLKTSSTRVATLIQKCLAAFPSPAVFLLPSERNFRFDRFHSLTR